MNNITYVRHCRNPDCGEPMTLSVKDEGNIVQCPVCEHYMRILNTRPCNIVSPEEIADIKAGTYSPENYKLGVMI